MLIFVALWAINTGTCLVLYSISKHQNSNPDSSKRNLSKSLPILFSFHTSSLCPSLSFSKKLKSHANSFITLSPSKKTNKPSNSLGHARPRAPSPTEKHLHTLPLTVQHRRTEITKINDPAKLRVAFTKRRKGLFKKSSALCERTGARAAVIVLSSTGRAHSFGDPSVEDMISDYLRCNGDVMLPMNLREWVDWVEKECESCVTEEDFVSLIMKYEAVLDCVRKKLKELENSPSAKAGAGGESGVGVGHDYEVLYDDEIHSLLGSFKASCPSLLAHFENCARNGDHGGFLTSSVNLAVGGGSSGVESIPMRSDLEGCGFDPDDFLNLSEEFVRNGFLTLPENSADDAGSSGEEPTCSDLEGYGYNPDLFVTLDDLDVSLGI